MGCPLLNINKWRQPVYLLWGPRDVYFPTQGSKNATCYDPFFMQSARKTHLLQSSRTRVAYISKMYLMVFTGPIGHFWQGPTCYAVFAYTFPQKMISMLSKHWSEGFKKARRLKSWNLFNGQRFCFAERLSSILHVCYLLVILVL